MSIIQAAFKGWMKSPILENFIRKKYGWGARIPLKIVSPAKG